MSSPRWLIDEWKITIKFHAHSRAQVSRIWSFICGKSLKMKIYIVIFFIYLTTVESRMENDKRVGGSNEIDVENPEVNELLEKHLPRIDTGSEGETFVKQKITKITSQVVSGMR